jgi:hyperosmotically inducible periplasmic protein
MKTTKLIALISCAAIIATPLVAAPDDTKIEEAAKASYNYRTVLEDHVRISCEDGVVTLTGTVPNQDLKALAEDTVDNLPGVTRVDNQIKVENPPPEHSDGGIAFKIHYQLLIRANVSATATTVKVTDGVVTLSGVADNQGQKDLTEFYARQVPGVKSVDNEMTIKTPPATPVEQYVDDTSITTEIKHELTTYPSTRGSKPAITTLNGTVVISGHADSSAQKSLITQLAENIRGVKSVTNDMTVAP